MRKLFLFATVVAAGLLAGCSSSDDVISEGGTPAGGNDDGDKTAIKIGISKFGETTRGTGTVGGVGTNNQETGYLANNWYGQRINVFMFKQNTLDYATEDVNDQPVKMYANRELITPGTTENMIPGMSAPNPGDQGEAMNADASIKYYPNTGNFDFFGYHLDDALDKNAINVSEEEGITITKNVDNDGKGVWRVPFTIDGSQDLLSTKAKLTVDQATIMEAKGTRQNDYYSAYAARALVQPTLTFNHLLSRLSFQVKPGNKEASGWGERFVISQYTMKSISKTEYDRINAINGSGISALYTVDNDNTELYNPNTADVAANVFDAYHAEVKKHGTPSDYSNGFNAERAVYVDSIRVKSMNKGELVVAWTPDQEVNATAPATGTIMPAYKKIVWNAQQVADNSDTKTTWAWLNLKERAAYEKNEGAVINPVTDITGYEEVNTALTTATNNLNDANTALSSANDDVDTKQQALTAAQTALQENTNENQTATLTQAVTDAQTALEASQTTQAAAVTAQAAAVTAKNNAQAAVDEYAELIRLLAKSTISATTWGKLTGVGQGKFAELTGDLPMNADMVQLTPTYPAATNASTYDAWQADNTQLGEALIVAPNIYDTDGNVTAAPMTMEVYLSQKVPTNWNWPYLYEKKTMSYPLTLTPGGNAAFEINKSYNVILTVYGFSRIDVTVTVNDWKAGGEIGIGGDND